MRIIEPGHWYTLDQLDQDKFRHSWSTVEIRFVSRMGDGYPGNPGAHPGTNLQEVWRACIDRLKYLNNQIPAWQSQAAIWCLRWAIWLLEHRAAKRHGRKFPWMLIACGELETLPTCKECGHIHGAEQQHPTHARS